MKFLKKIKSINRFLVLTLLIPSLNSVNSQANLHVTTSVLTPQLRSFDTESVYWSSLIHFSQNNKWFQVQGSFDWGSTTQKYVNPFRIYDLNARLKLGNHSLALGRLLHWSSLTHTRVDGIEAVIKTKKFGQLKLIGGFKATEDFSDTSFVQPEFFNENQFLDKMLFLTSWSIGRLGKSFSISAWGDGHESSITPYLGISSSYRLGSFRLNESLVGELENNRLQYGRIHLYKTIGSHRIGLGYRQGRYKGISSWSWLNTISIPATYSLNWTWVQLGKFYLYNSVNLRPGTTQTFFINSSLSLGNYTLTLLSGSKNHSRIFGGSLGITQEFNSSVSYGGNISLNVISYNGLIDPVNASSLYGWLNWDILEKLRLKFFGRYSVNPYYKKDGRAGLVVYVKI